MIKRARKKLRYHLGGRGVTSVFEIETRRLGIFVSILSKYSNLLSKFDLVVTWNIDKNRNTRIYATKISWQWNIWLKRWSFGLIIHRLELISHRYSLHTKIPTSMETNVVLKATVIEGDATTSVTSILAQAESGLTDLLQSLQGKSYSQKYFVGPWI